MVVEQGLLQGSALGGAHAFLGVPYAAPPVGAWRFRPPRPAQRWTGPRQATRQAPACRQFSPFGLADPTAVSEDCLYLDVYRPHRARPGSRLPVILWIHGGAYTQGTGTQFGGQTLARLTDSVVVSINYRLGRLGYLDLDGLADGNRNGSGSWGLMDQIAALTWTRDNVAAFGGDPGNITVSGQSAGSGSVCALLASPRASGLFSRAILQSGPCSLLRAPSREQARAQAESFAAAVGCPDPRSRAACLREAPVQALETAAQNIPVAGPAYGDGLLPHQPSEAIASGTWNRVPVLIGTTRAEGRFFVALSQPHLTSDQYTAQIHAQYGPAATEVLTRYPLSDRVGPYLAMSALMTDSLFACPTVETARAFARQVPTYAYEFDDPASPTLLGAQVPGLDMANGHSAELAYVHDFALTHTPLTPVQNRFADTVKRYWGAFARSGRPDVPGLPRWSPVGPGYEVLTLKPDAIHMSDAFASAHQCAFWNRSTHP
ncbi:carboxylesterase family protein [Streptomyces sp. CC208A]|uniref:carboxylesterase/lipase family protein n=1 Tax=Streptomyces sp. CC208A TaxID=3044573 RepID=UPI0024A95C55|nr:carboxylesterase family protein [Streptomyces sp. CC208A]